MGIPKGPELLVILAIVLLLFGARKLPELARSIGRSARELRSGYTESDEPTSIEEEVESAGVSRVDQVADTPHVPMAGPDESLSTSIDDGAR
jgi:sec-independent protein translocase protein TatA